MQSSNLYKRIHWSQGKSIFRSPRPSWTDVTIAHLAFKKDMHSFQVTCRDALLWMCSIGYWILNITEVPGMVPTISATMHVHILKKTRTPYNTNLNQSEWRWVHWKAKSWTMWRKHCKLQILKFDNLEHSNMFEPKVLTPWFHSGESCNELILANCLNCFLKKQDFF
jgi:hypothetical protein